MSNIQESKISHFLKGLFWVCLCCVFLALLYSYDNTMVITLCVGIVLLFISYKTEIPHFAAVLFVLAFLIRLLFALTIDTPIISDFATQYEAAQKFAVGDMSFQESSYFQTWGYQTGLVIYEGLLLKIWNNPMILRLSNCVFSAGTAVLVYLFAKEFFEVKAAQCASLFYTLFVFHATYVTVLSNSIPSAFFIYLSVYLSVTGRPQKWNFILRYALSALCLAVANFFRADTLVILVAMLAYFIFGVFKELKKKNILHFATRALCFFAVYFILTTAFSQLIIWGGINSSGLKNGDPLWTIVVGTNHSSHGGYSDDDLRLIAERMETEGVSRSEAEMSIIKERLSVSPGALFTLAKKKICHFWWSNPLSWALGHMSSGYYSFAVDLNQSFFLIAALLAAIGIFSIYRNKRGQLKAYLLPFIIFATFCAYLVIEVQPRYAYMVQIAVFSLAAGGFQMAAPLLQRMKRKPKAVEKVCQAIAADAAGQE